ncbi:MAG: DUF1673 domain-containing protein [Methanoregulaceae archaeon]|nr:DUF1673 domain-containing protein [Methanoregulaceae archaeon]
MELADRFRQYLGWCPRACTPVGPVPVAQEGLADAAPVQGSGMPAPVGKLKRYRDQVLLWAVTYTLAFSLFVPGFLGSDLTRLMQVVGISAGLVFSAFSGRWLWHRFGKLARGETVKPGMEVKVIVAFIIGIILISVLLLVMGVLSVIPYGTAMALPAFAMGFGIFIPWYTLVLVLLWEQRSGYVLIFDKKILQVIATRRSADAPR